MRTHRPIATEHAPYYGRYISQVPDGDIVATLSSQIETTLKLLRALPESAGGRRYEEGKWSVREVIAHLIDAERVFAYRALTFARNDATPLPGFDENQWAAENRADSRTIADLCDEFAAVRRGNVHFFSSLNSDEWGRSGLANNNAISVRAIAWIAAGHEIHHRNILQTRYL